MEWQRGISSSLGYRGLSVRGLLQSGRSQAGYTGRSTAIVPPQSGFADDDFIRPMTAVRGAGYTSQGRPGTGLFDPLNQKLQGPPVGFEKIEET